MTSFPTYNELVEYYFGGEPPHAAFGLDVGGGARRPLGPFSETMQTLDQQWAGDMETGASTPQSRTTQWNEQNQNAQNPFAFSAGPGGVGGGGANPADKLLSFMGAFNDHLEARQQQRDWNALQQKTGRTENMGVNNPLNPFGNYTPNVGLGNNFQPGRQAPTQRPGFEVGGEYQLSDQEIANLRQQGYQVDVLD